MQLNIIRPPIFSRRNLSRHLGMVLLWIGVLGLIMPAATWSQETDSLTSKTVFSRPTCHPKHVLKGTSMCLNPSMKSALKLYESKAYQQQFDSKITSAMAYLKRIQPAKNKVILTDVDDTLIDNAQYWGRHDRYDRESWFVWMNRTDTPPKLHNNVIQLLREAKRLGFSVMLVTGRSCKLTSSTFKQLADIEWDGAYFRPVTLNMAAQQYKTQVRQLIRNLGYEIVLNVGDQASDFDTPILAEEGEFLLPNVFYTIP